ncbi:MAG: MFS transporter [Pseudomonadaceae bacterium]
MTVPSEPTLDALAPQPASSTANANWGAVWAMSLCAFAMVASEFLPVSLLTPMAADLAVSEGAVGQGIAMSGLFALLTALSISSLAGNLNRRALLLGLTVIMVLSAILVGVADSYALYMAGRVLVGVALGGFWSLSAAAAVRLVPTEQVTKALAIFNAGNALAMVLAAPLGSYLGSVIGWRGAFLCLAPVATVTLIWQWARLPSMAADSNSKPLTAIFRPLGRKRILLGYSGTALLFAGQFVLFTYIRPYLEITAGVDAYTLSSILLLMGIAGFVGTTLINRFLQWNLQLTLCLMPALLAVIAVLLIQFAGNLLTVTLLLAGWGFIATAAPVGWWAWVAGAMTDDTEAGGGLMVAFVQLAIGLGSTLGGVLFDQLGYQLTFAVSALLLVVGALSVLLLRRLEAAERR